MNDESDGPLLAAWLRNPDGEQPAILRLLLELSLAVAGAEEGSLLLLDGTGRQLVFAMTVGDARSQAALAGQRVPVGQGVVGLAALTHEVQVGSPTYTDVKQSAERERQGGPAWVLAAPVLAHDDLLGVITAITFRADLRLGQAAAELLGRAAAVAGVVLDQGRRLAQPAPPDGPGAGAARRAADVLLDSAAAHPDKLRRLADLFAALQALL